MIRDRIRISILLYRFLYGMLKQIVSKIKLPLFQFSFAFLLPGPANLPPICMILLFVRPCFASCRPHQTLRVSVCLILVRTNKDIKS